MISTGPSDVTQAPPRETPNLAALNRTSRFAFSPLQLTFGYSCLILILLQVWRPFYFMSDDSLLYTFPLIKTIGEQILHGQSPVVNPYLFNGYHLLSDPTSISFWNPLVLGLALLANSRFYLTTIDIFCSVNLLASAMAFTLLLCRLRELKSLNISDGRIVFLCLSFTFSSYALSIGTCWLVFLANPTCLSLVTIGLLAEKKSLGIRYVAAGLMFGMLVGHLSPFLFSVLFLSVFSGMLCWEAQSWKPLQIWIYGGLLAILLASPVLVPSALGFMGSTRSASLSIPGLTRNAVPLAALVGSFFAGYIAIFAGAATGLFSLRLLYGLSSCAAAGLFWGSVHGFKKLSRLEIAVGVTVLFVGLDIVRPHWLAVILSHMPLFRSLRWPFREVFILLFFVHLWMALRPVIMAPHAYMAVNLVGVAIFFASLCIINPWCFSPVKIDRELLRNGKAEAYWAKLRPEFGPNDRLISIVDPPFADHHATEIPFTLLGAFNFPALFKVPSISGYTAPGIRSRNALGDVPYHLGGMYSDRVGMRMLAKNPHLKALRLISVDPPRIDFCTSRGCRAVEVPSYTRPEIAGSIAGSQEHK